MTLENSKSYGRQERTKTLQDISRTRLNGPTPHQAPQRERVTMAQIPGARGRTRDRKNARRWVDMLRPDINMGVPQLMMILEPYVVWEHVTGTCSATGRPVEATYAIGEFFEAWHKGGKPANGVYEGSYWELIGDCDELIEMLKKLSKAPTLMDEPALLLPASADLPKWEDFKPVLQTMPAAPELPPCRLPPFMAPILDSEVPFIEPNYLPVPEVPDQPQEEAAPIFFPPTELEIEAFDPPHYVDLEPPIIPEVPKAPQFGKPQHGHDWTGTRPFIISSPKMNAPTLMEVPAWNHPPGKLPRLSLIDDLQMDTADLDLEPLPRLELAWECGPEPEPSYASMHTTPRLMSRAGSPPRSRPLSATPAGSSRPYSASSAGPYPSPAPLTVHATAPPSAQASGPHTGPPTPWEDVLEVDSGKPRVWLNFEKPFAELPPVFMPPYPEPGPEPMPEDFPHDPLEADPSMRVAEPMEVPEWVPPKQRAPQWAAPTEPRPIGFVRGTAPVIIMDVSGTMNPRINGRFKDMKECVCELLEPDGELATAAGAFDVIAFCNAAWSWSATFAQRMDLLANSQTFYSGRQVGGKIRPGTARQAMDHKGGAQLMPTEHELLLDAQNWVAKWPDAVGHTSMLSSFQMADQHWNADCWYMFSDGLADDPSLCLDFIESRLRNNEKCPVIHCVGFFPLNVNDNFEGRRYLKQLAALTGGSFQEYDKDLQRIYKEGEGFVELDLSTVHPDDVPERLWVEAQLRAERRKNLRLGIFERLEVTMSRIQAIHLQQRILPVKKQQERELERLRSEYEASIQHIREHNDDLQIAAVRAFDEESEAVQARNQEKLNAAKRAYLEAHAEWQKAYDDACQEWEAQKAGLERDRADAMAALNGIIFSRGGSPGRSRPQSGIHLPRASRPTSARPPVSGNSRPQSARRDSISEVAPAAGGRGGGSESGGTWAGEPRVVTYQPLDASGACGAQRPVSATPARLSAAAAALERANPDALRPTAMASDMGSPSTQATPHDGPSRPQSGRRERPMSGLRLRLHTDEVGGLGDISEEGVYNDYEEDPPPLLLGDEQELARIIHPAEVVEQLDRENAERLSEIRSEWDKLVEETASRNAKKLELLQQNQAIIDEHIGKVVDAYAESFVKSVVIGGAIRETVNLKLQKNAEDEFAAATARVLAENERVAKLHCKEVAEKEMKEEQFQKLYQQWETTRDAIKEKHTQDVAASKEAHAKNLERLKQEWDERKIEIAKLNASRLAEAEGLHLRVVEEVKEVNRKYRAEHAEKLRERKAIEGKNASLLSQARELHKSKLVDLAILNEHRMEQAQEEHQALCVRLQIEHEEAKRAAEEEFEELRVFMMQHNESLMEEARKKFQEAIHIAQNEFQVLCKRLQEEHSIELERVRKRNKEIWPQVQVARLAQAELARVMAFAEHIKFCANKFQLGINFMAGMPNWDRVVEMQALTEALRKAYPDIDEPGEYPWPDEENKYKVGHGWTAAPTPMQLNLPDPAEEIMRLAAGRNSARRRQQQRPSSAAPSYGNKQGMGSVGAGAAAPAWTVPSREKSTPDPTVLTPGQLAHIEMQQALAEKWAAARNAHTSTMLDDASEAQNSRVRFSNLANSPRQQSAHPASAHNTSPARPQTASPSGRPQSETSRSQTASAPGSASGSAAGSPSPSPAPDAMRRSASSIQELAKLQGVDSPSLPPSPSPYKPRANAYSIRPVSASPYLIGSHPDPMKRPLSSRALSARPPIARTPHLAARMSIDMSNMHVAMSRAKAVGNTNAGNKGRMNAASPARKANGFSKDMPRTLFSEVDVTTIDI